MPSPRRQIRAAAGEGDIILTLDGSDSDTLGEDGYVLEISDRVNITAPSAQGLFYGMVTVVQSYYADGGRALRKSKGLCILSHKIRHDRRCARLYPA